MPRATIRQLRGSVLRVGRFGVVQRRLHHVEGLEAIRSLRVSLGGHGDRLAVRALNAEAESVLGLVNLDGSRLDGRLLGLAADAFRACRGDEADGECERRGRENLVHGENSRWWYGTSPAHSRRSRR